MWGRFHNWAGHFSELKIAYACVHRPNSQYNSFFSLSGASSWLLSFLRTSSFTEQQQTDLQIYAIICFFTLNSCWILLCFCNANAKWWLPARHRHFLASWRQCSPFQGSSDPPWEGFEYPAFPAFSGLNAKCNQDCGKGTHNIREPENFHRTEHVKARTGDLRYLERNSHGWSSSDLIPSRTH